MTPKRGLTILVLLAAMAAFAFAADITGIWTATFETQVGTQAYTFTFKQSGTKLTGKAVNAFAKAETEISEGTVNGDDISFIENLTYEGMPLRIVYKGKITGDEMKLTRNVAEIADEQATAKRSK
jgi:hypothetical protein